ncbi:protein drumstick-like isoform X2 [Tachypleus tridentatus]|uniref:protein drumstick-like isoform X2 n=1 Tax=Tachypleus tridentatus TaxID=6853 RepID=UPI003FD646B0
MYSVLSFGTLVPDIEIFGSVHIVDAYKKTSFKKKMCPYCRSFFHQASFSRHLNTHREVRQSFSCDICGKTYSRKDHLHGHKRLKHR